MTAKTVLHKFRDSHEWYCHIMTQFDILLEIFQNPCNGYVERLPKRERDRQYA